MNTSPRCYAFRALWLAAKAASIRYRSPLPPAALAHTLATGHLPWRYVAHVSRLLDEAPMPLLKMAVAETSRRKRVAVAAIWGNMARLADELGLVRRSGAFRELRRAR